MSDFERLLDAYRDAMERCIHNELHNAHPNTLADEKISAESMRQFHRKELEARQAVIRAYELECL